MKRSFLSLLFIFSIITSKAQNFELSVLGNLGMSRNAGQSTVSTTFLNDGDPNDHSGYPNGAGNRFALSYGTGLQWQYTFKCNFILGLQTGYEVISSKADINGVYDGNENSEVPATGYTSEHAGYINLNPYIGYRIKLNKVRFDILPGLDVAFGESANTTVNVNASDHTYYNKTTQNFGKPGDEVRLRLGLAAYYQKFGFTASYSRGMDHFAAYADAYVPPEYIQVFRLGLSYRIL